METAVVMKEFCRVWISFALVVLHELCAVGKAIGTAAQSRASSISIKQRAELRGIVLFQELLNIRDAGEGDFTAGKRLALCWCHPHKDGVAPEAMIDFVDSARQLFRFTARYRRNQSSLRARHHPYG